MSQGQFAKLSIRNWRQFGHVEIDFHPQLTVLTGANGAGKSTLLGILARHFGWERPLLGTPIANKTTGAITWLSAILNQVTGKGKTPPPRQLTIGSLAYCSGQQAKLNVPVAAHTYQVEISDKQNIPGLHIGSHRHLSSYQRVTNVTTEFDLRSAYGNYAQESQSHYQGHHGGNSVFRLKESLIAMAMFGEGNSVIKPNSDVLETYRGFIETLRTLLPDELGFKNIEIRIPEVVVVTESGSWPIDSASGGIMSIIDIAWTIYLHSKRSKDFAVTIDEPENHLHPSMQRSLLTNLIKTFPSVQFIVATHSPFIITSTPNSNVYVLNFRDDEKAPSEQTARGERRVDSVSLDDTSKSGSANEILREVLGVPATIPIWVEGELQDIVNRQRERPINDEMLASLREDLKRLGFSEYYPETLAAVVSKR